MNYKLKAKNMNWNPNTALIPYQPINFQMETFKDSIKNLDIKLEAHKFKAKSGQAYVIFRSGSVSRNSTDREIACIEGIKSEILELEADFNGVSSGYSKERFSSNSKIVRKKLHALMNKCEKYLKEHRELSAFQHKYNPARLTDQAI